MFSWLPLGFAMGVRHALEADHLAAVASLSARAARPRELVRVAAVWGAGHALTSFVVALLWVSTGVTLSDGAQSLAEAAAGFLLIGLGFDLLRRRKGGWARFHLHDHRDGTRHQTLVSTRIACGPIALGAWISAQAILPLTTSSFGI